MLLCGDTISRSTLTSRSSLIKGRCPNPNARSQDSRCKSMPALVGLTRVRPRLTTSCVLQLETHLRKSPKPRKHQVLYQHATLFLCGSGGWAVFALFFVHVRSRSRAGVRGREVPDALCRCDWPAASRVRCAAPLGLAWNGAVWWECYVTGDSLCHWDWRGSELSGGSVATLYIGLVGGASCPMRCAVRIGVDRSCLVGALRRCGVGIGRRRVVSGGLRC